MLLVSVTLSNVSLVPVKLLIIMCFSHLSFQTMWPILQAEIPASIWQIQTSRHAWALFTLSIRTSRSLQRQHAGGCFISLLTIPISLCSYMYCLVKTLFALYLLCFQKSVLVRYVSHCIVSFVLFLGSYIVPIIVCSQKQSQMYRHWNEGQTAVTAACFFIVLIFACSEFQYCERAEWLCSISLPSWNFGISPFLAILRYLVFLTRENVFSPSINWFCPFFQGYPENAQNLPDKNCVFHSKKLAYLSVKKLRNSLKDINLSGKLPFTV